MKHHALIALVFHVRQGQDVSGDNEKIFHRSLDVLHFWISDCRRVDFTPKSSLVDTLKGFLITEVTLNAVHFALRSCESNSCAVTFSVLPRILCTRWWLLCCCHLLTSSSFNWSPCSYVSAYFTPLDTENVEQQE